MGDIEKLSRYLQDMKDNRQFADDRELLLYARDLFFAIIPVVNTHPAWNSHEYQLIDSLLTWINNKLFFVSFAKHRKPRYFQVLRNELTFLSASAFCGNYHRLDEEVAKKLRSI